VGGLVQIGDPKAVPALIELMRGKEPGFSKEVVFAIGAIGGDEAQAYLYTVAQGHEEGPVRQAAQQALDELRERGAQGSQQNTAERQRPTGLSKDKGTP
jgi:HEAT repeat protein